MIEQKGRFIALEGMEGAGKSTVMQHIEYFLADKAPHLIVTREPGGTTIGEKLRAITKEKMPAEKLSDKAELLLMYAARVQLVEQVIRPALAKGEWILADRFELSSFAYQGGGRGIDENFIQQLSTFCLNGLQPDLTIFLDITPEQGLARIKSRGGEIDRIEQEAIDFFYDVYRAYHRNLKRFPHVIIDATQPAEKVCQQVINQLKNNLVNWME